MFSSTALLTFATFAGLLAGFAREWLLIADWGATRATDAFLVAMFLPEALRTMLSGGLLSAACLPLWQETPSDHHPAWLATQARHWLVVGLGLAMTSALLSTWLVRMVGPGLPTAESLHASRVLVWLSMSAPFLLLLSLIHI